MQRESMHVPRKTVLHPDIISYSILDWWSLLMEAINHFHHFWFSLMLADTVA